MGMPSATASTVSQAVLAEPSHEPSDEDDRGDVQPGERHGADIDRGRNDDAHDLAKLSPFGEQLVIVFAQSVPQVYRAGDDDEDSDVEWKEAGARTFRAPVDAGLHAADDHDHAEEGDQQRDPRLHQPVGGAGLARTACGHQNSMRGRACGPLRPGVYAAVPVCGFDQSISFPPWRGSRHPSSGPRDAFPRPRPTWHSQPRSGRSC